MKLLLSLIFVIQFCAMAQAKYTCAPGKIRISETDPEKDISRRICHDDLKKVFVSENCLKGNCSVLSNYLTKKDVKVKKSAQNRGRKICEGLGLKASQVSYILTGDEVIKSDMCFDEADRSFISTNKLTED